MRDKTLVLVVLGSTLLLTSGCRSEQPPITENELVRRTQEMMDAVVPGNRGPWEKYFAGDAMYFDEKGHNMDKAALLGDLSPMPAGYSGSIRIVRPLSHIEGATAILSYDMEETETIFGQNMTARYHATDTWMRRNGNWQIVAGQVLRYYEDPAVGAANPKGFADYVGIYELTAGKTLTVYTKDGQLHAQRQDREPEQLLTESGDVYFRKGVEGRTLFRRAAGGQVDALVDRRNNEDIVWRKRR
ncbi:MAG TPA: DUF4440 domain-containing protein [Candidatus Saccharimonadales bacterium]|nr:DUF4440 domain-containing protein [Candidatus Saccharimonadales bacterium]